MQPLSRVIPRNVNPTLNTLYIQTSSQNSQLKSRESDEVTSISFDECTSKYKNISKSHLSPHRHPFSPYNSIITTSQRFQSQSPRRLRKPDTIAEDLKRLAMIPSEKLPHITMKTDLSRKLLNSPILEMKLNSPGS